MQRKICTFSCSAKIYDIDSIKEKLRNEIVHLTENYEITTFYNIENE